MKTDISDADAIALMANVMSRSKLEEESTAMVEFMLMRGLSPIEGLIVIGNIVEGTARALSASGVVE